MLYLHWTTHGIHVQAVDRTQFLCGNGVEWCCYIVDVDWLDVVDRMELKKKKKILELFGTNAVQHEYYKDNLMASRQL